MQTDAANLAAAAVPWAAGLVLLAAGAVLACFGSRWRSFTESLVVALAAGTVAALLAPPEVLRAKTMPLIGGACLAGSLAAVFLRRIVLALLVLLTVGASATLMAAGLLLWPTVPHVVSVLSSPEAPLVVHLPNVIDLSAPLPLIVLVAGAMLGLLLAAASPGWARRVAMGLLGALALLTGGAVLSGGVVAAHWPPEWPMTYGQAGALAWLELALISMILQRRIDRPAAEADPETDDAETRRDATGPDR